MLHGSGSFRASKMIQQQQQQQKYRRNRGEEEEKTPYIGQLACVLIHG